jgi:hypothetical protein
MGRFAKVLPFSEKDKEYLSARQQSAKYCTPTITTTSEAASEAVTSAHAGEQAGVRISRRKGQNTYSYWSASTNKYS